MDPLKAKGVKPIALDVTNEESMKIAIETIIKNEGRIDILVNNAGYGSYGAINVSSMGGRLTSYLSGWYHASKHAIEGFSDCLRMEVKEFDIKVVVLEPGMINTGFNATVGQNFSYESKNGAYSRLVNGYIEAMENNPTPGSNPEVISRAVLKIINARNPKTRYLVGRGGKLLVAIRRIFGYKFFDRMMLMSMR